MNAILLTVLALGGDGAAYYGGSNSFTPVVGASYTGECDQCSGYGGRRGGHAHGEHHGCLGTMPQSCYEPSFGCYTNSRFMQRYTAFHGTYYRRAYNYRNYFDYPWHAGLHEPTSHFSYHVPGEQPLEAVPPPQPESPVSSFLPRPIYRPTVRQTMVSDEVVDAPAYNDVVRQAYRTNWASATPEPTPAQPRMLPPIIPDPAAGPTPADPETRPMAPVAEPASELRKLPR